MSYVIDAAAHGAAQVILGIGEGYAINQVFENGQDSEDINRVTMDVLLQGAMTGLAMYATARMLGAAGVQDPNQGYIFGLMLIASQPKLIQNGRRAITKWLAVAAGGGSRGTADHE